MHLSNISLWVRVSDGGNYLDFVFVLFFKCFCVKYFAILVLKSTSKTNFISNIIFVVSGHRNSIHLI